MKRLIGLLLIGSNVSQARRLHKNHHHNHHKDNMMLQIDTTTVLSNQIDSHGIFDKAIAKIEREANEKQDARNMLAELHERELMENKRNSMHQKHLLAAQKEAEEMFKSMQSEAEMTAQEKLNTIIGDQIKQEDEQKKQKEQEEGDVQQGFLADTTKKMRKDAGLEESQESQALKNQSLVEKVQTVVAPKMAEEALSQALNIKQTTTPSSISTQSIAEMKKNMRSKMSHVSVAQTQNDISEQQTVGEGSALEQFDMLKAIENRPVPEEQKEKNLSQEEKKVDIDPEQASINAAHKRHDSPSADFMASLNQEIEQDDSIKKQSLADESKQFRRAAPVSASVDEDFDNPISALTALKHPEIMQKAMIFNYDDDMFSHY